MVTLGRAVAEPIEDARRALHETLASVLLGGHTPRLEYPSETTILSFKQLSIEPTLIRELFSGVELEPDALVIVDLAGTPYDLLGERFLKALSERLAAAAKDSSRTVLVLLPGLPPWPTSLLWLHLQELANEGAGRVIVLDDEGAMQAFGASDPAVPTAELAEERKRVQADLVGSARDRFGRKLVRRLGHFGLVGRDGAKLCGRYYWDASLAESDLTLIIGAWLRRHFKRPQLEGAKAVLCGVTSAWMQDATIAAAKRVGLDYDVLPTAPNARQRHKLLDQRNILMFDVISSGATLAATLRFFSKWNIPVESRAFTALATSKAVLRDSSINIDEIQIVNQQVTSRDDCRQCLAGISFSPLGLFDEPAKILSFDMWAMLCGVEWGPEPYTPEGQPAYEYIPDFEQVFHDYGDWIAYKYAALLKERNHTSDVVVVCPDEPRVQRLVQRLRARYEERLVAVSVPRTLVDNITKRRGLAGEVAGAARDEASQEDWRVQLLQLSDDGVAVLVLDEFNASGRTARSMVALLEAFGIEVAAYLPFLDWNTDTTLRHTPVEALYTIPRPRPA